MISYDGAKWGEIEGDRCDLELQEDDKRKQSSHRNTSIFLRWQNVTERWEGALENQWQTIYF